jgi:hypothetical protein
MVEFMTGYTSAMDRVEEPIKPMDEPKQDIERPIIPISEIGTTSVDSGQGNILQNLERNIFIGTKKVQLIIGSSRSGPSQFASQYGKAVREAIREKAKATGVEITGIEMSPQILAGMTGMSQGGALSEQKRYNDIQQVKDAIRFVADLGGGNVDIWSSEFQRPIATATWNKEKDGRKQFYEFTEEELDPKTGKDFRSQIVRYLMDKRTGEPIRDSVVREGDGLDRVRWQTAKDFADTFGKPIIGKKDKAGRIVKADDLVDFEGNVVSQYKDEDIDRLVPYIGKDGKFDPVHLSWEQIVEETNRYNKENGAAKGSELQPEEWLYRQRMLQQRARVQGQSLYWSRNLQSQRFAINELTKLQDVAEELEQKMSPEEQRDWIETTVLPRLGDKLSAREREMTLTKKPSEVVRDQVLRVQNAIRSEEEQAASYAAAIKDIDERINQTITPDKYAKEKVWDSYMQLGIDAMNVTKERKLKKPVYVGPEIGFANQMYGGHPEEFKEIILGARERMVNQLMSKGMAKDTAEEKAKTHIKGMLDTSHMAMWYKHFAKNKGESEDEHLKRFNKWLKDQAKMLVKAGVVGGIQVVDTYTGEHSHLPAGQGRFDVAGIVYAMREEEWKGDIISEGHEEDTNGFGTGRILTETWKAFGSNIGPVGYGQRAGLRSWGGIQQAYFGQNRPITYVAGAYSPSNEWTLWSDTPFE